MRARRSSATRSLESERPSDRRKTLVGAMRRTTSGANPRRARYRLASRDPVTAVVRSARTSNERVKRELGWQPRFPSAREGVPDAVARLS